MGSADAGEVHREMGSPGAGEARGKHSRKTDVVDDKPYTVPPLCAALYLSSLPLRLRTIQNLSGRATAAHFTSVVCQKVCTSLPLPQRDGLVLLLLRGLLLQEGAKRFDAEAL